MSLERWSMIPRIRESVFDVSRTQVIIDHAGNQRVGFAASGTISRKDFGLLWNFVLETGGVMVGDRVTLTAELEAVRLPDNRQVSALACKPSAPSPADSGSPESGWSWRSPRARSCWPQAAAPAWCGCSCSRSRRSSS